MSLEAYGDILAAIDWFKRLDGQTRRYEADETMLLRHLGRGDGSVAPARLSLAEAARRADTPVEWVVPESGGPLLVQGVAVVTGAADADAARAFVEWLGRPEAAQALSDELHRVPASFVAEPSRLGWLPDAATALGGHVPSADTLAANLDAWIERWKRDARGRGSRIYIP